VQPSLFNSEFLRRHSDRVAFGGVTLRGRGCTHSSCVCRLATQSQDQHLLLYQIVSADGQHVQSTPIPTSRGQLMHDFGITRNFAVFVEQSLVFDPFPMFVSDTLPITYDKDAQCRCRPNSFAISPGNALQSPPHLHLFWNPAPLLKRKKRLQAVDFWSIPA
jgi:hypothetical protein